MAIRQAIVPVIGTGISTADPFRPKYLDGLRLSAQYVRKGTNPSVFVTINMTPAQAVTLASRPDVVMLPQGIDDGRVSLGVADRSALRALFLPPRAITWNDARRDIVDAAFISQVAYGKGIDLFSQVSTLDDAVTPSLLTRWASAGIVLPNGLATVVAALHDAIDSLPDRVPTRARDRQEAAVLIGAV
jgi:hypothetical protein